MDTKTKKLAHLVSEGDETAVKELLRALTRIASLSEREAWVIKENSTGNFWSGSVGFGGEITFYPSPHQAQAVLKQILKIHRPSSSISEPSSTVEYALCHIKWTILDSSPIEIKFEPKIVTATRHRSVFDKDGHVRDISPEGVLNPEPPSQEELSLLAEFGLL